jgi:yeast amino acid transporter
VWLHGQKNNNKNKNKNKISYTNFASLRGRPMVSLLIALIFGGLAYIGLASSGITVFNWLLAISGLSQFFTWGSICLCHIRFRSGWKAKGHSLDEIPFRSAVGVIGSLYGFLFNVLCLIAQFYVAVWPPGTGVCSRLIFIIIVLPY